MPTTVPIQGIGCVPMSLWSGKDCVKPTLPDAVHIAEGNGLPRSQMRWREKDSDDAPEKRKDSFWTLGRKTEKISGFRRPLNPSDFALATIAPGQVSSVSPQDIDMFYEFHEHVHETSFRPTVKRLGILLEGTLRECEDTRSLRVFANRSVVRFRQWPMKYSVSCS